MLSTTIYQIQIESSGDALENFFTLQEAEAAVEKMITADIRASVDNLIDRLSYDIKSGSLPSCITEDEAASLITEITSMREEGFCASVILDTVPSYVFYSYQDTDAEIVDRASCEAYYYIAEITLSSFSDIVRAVSPMPMTRLSEILHVPYRTLQNWKDGVNEAPSYVINLLVYYLLREGYLKP